MNIELHDCRGEFYQWTPRNGTIYQRLYAFDIETAAIDQERPWITPPYVVGAAYDGKRGFFVERQHVLSFLKCHWDARIIFHHAPFDLDVLKLLLGPALDVYDLVERNRIWDTELLHRLYTLGNEGHVARGKGQATLERCAQVYLDAELPKNVEDSKGQPVRTSYGQWLNRPLADIEPCYLEYLGKDVIATYHLYRELRKRLKGLLEDQDDTFGFVSQEWLQRQRRRWGPQTHHIQLKAAVALKAITAEGLHIDLGRREELVQQLQLLEAEHLEVLRSHGYQPGTGGNKALQEIFRGIDARHRKLTLPRTAARGDYQTSQEALESLRGVEPFVDSLLACKAVQKLISAFLKKMGKKVLHPSFTPLLVTGRTSSHGDINAQNLPRDDRVRSCIVPPPGHVFIIADYSAVEMTTLGQGLLGQFKMDSKLADALNAGKDPHRLVAARVTGKHEDQVTRDERQKAKAINFGKPGGMGLATLQAYAKTSYGVELNEQETERLSESWFDEFPEMREFLRDEDDLPKLATFFDLTFHNHFTHTDDPRFLKHPANEGYEHSPNSILAKMLLKTLRLERPETQGGRLYSQSDIDYFWTQVANRIHDLPSKYEHAIRNRKPSKDLQQAIRRFIDRAGVFTYTGRLRAKATYSARHNTIFQGLAADGAKLGLWYVWRAGYRVANFIHDELLVAVPENSNLGYHAEVISYLMLKGMKAVVPDVAVDVEYTISDRWYKKAELVLDARGRLAVWSAESDSQEPLATSV